MPLLRFYISQSHITEQMHKHYKYFRKTSFSQCLENTTNAWMASNHINYTNTRMSQAETRKYSFIIDSRWYIIHATLWKHEEILGLYINWGIKAANGSVSIKLLTLNTASIGLRNRRGRAWEGLSNSGHKSSRESCVCTRSNQNLTHNVTFTCPYSHHTNYHLL